MYIRYNIYSWTPPKLTPEQEIYLGREISLEGREAFLRRNHPYLSKNEQDQVQMSQNMTRSEKIKILVIGTLFFGPMIIFVPAIPLVALLALTPIIGLSMGSLVISRNRYRLWVDKMIAKYAKYVAETQRHQLK
jgi:hypothetical protein